MPQFFQPPLRRHLWLEPVELFKLLENCVHTALVVRNFLRVQQVEKAFYLVDLLSEGAKADRGFPAAQNMLDKVQSLLQRIKFNELAYVGLGRIQHQLQ